jgi:hypothetical protein
LKREAIPKKRYADAAAMPSQNPLPHRAQRIVCGAQSRRDLAHAALRTIARGIRLRVHQRRLTIPAEFD